MPAFGLSVVCCRLSYAYVVAILLVLNMLEGMKHTVACVL